MDGALNQSEWEVWEDGSAWLNITVPPRFWALNYGMVSVSAQCLTSSTESAEGTNEDSVRAVTGK